MSKIKIEEIDFLIKKYPFLYLPFLLKLNDSSDKKYDSILNSLALRHPNRSYLKLFLKKNINKENQILDLFLKKNKTLKSRNKHLLVNNTKDLSKPLLKKNEFISENLAKIFIQQDKIDDAIKIYEKLILLNSKKKELLCRKN